MTHKEMNLTEQEKTIIEKFRAADPVTQAMFLRFCEKLFLDDHSRDLDGRKIGIVKHI